MHFNHFWNNFGIQCAHARVQYQSQLTHNIPPPLHSAHGSLWTGIPNCTVFWLPAINCGKQTVALHWGLYNADHRKGRKHHRYHPNMLTSAISHQNAVKMSSMFAYCFPCNGCFSFRIWLQFDGLRSEEWGGHCNTCHLSTPKNFFTLPTELAELFHLGWWHFWPILDACTKPWHRCYCRYNL